MAGRPLVTAGQPPPVSNIVLLPNAHKRTRDHPAGHRLPTALPDTSVELLGRLGAEEAAASYGTRMFDLERETEVDREIVGTAG